MRAARMVRAGAAALVALALWAPGALTGARTHGLEAGCASGTAPPVSTTRAGTHAAVDGWSGDQLANAAAVMNAARALGLPHQAEVVGVMTAMGESSLRNLDHGDGAVNPDGTVADSIGLFQQQHWWGTTAQRLDPYDASIAFFRALERVPGWLMLRPTIAAHDVQVNADPEYYTKNLVAAERVVRALDRLSVRGSTCRA
jgi:hypothetical protein